MRFACFALTLVGLAAYSTAARAEAPVLRAGFAKTDITPDVAAKDKPVWMAGFGMGRRATGVHDPLYCRCAVLEAGERKIALAVVDLIGLQYPQVEAIRARLKDFHYVLVASTHNHEGPDVIGIWGATPITTGVNAAYLDLVVERTVTAVREAEKSLAEVTAAYGTAQNDLLLHDSREPRALDGVLRALRLNAASSGKPALLITQYSCHPESLGSKNTLLTADFPHATIAALEKQFGCPVVYFSGAVGGLMSNPGERKFGNKTLRDGSFEFAEQYGAEVAGVFAQALERAEPIVLTPFTVSAKKIVLPLENHLYRAARAIGVLKRTGRAWTGDFEKVDVPENNSDPVAVESEVGYLRLGALHVAAIPGEIYPELVYGAYQEPADAGADFPEAPLEKPLVKILPSDKWLLLGLANDEVGYIIPKRQWDRSPPYAYGRKESQYGEINSCGPEIGPIIMQAFERCVKESTPRE